jgi:(1->4)-alpha-D-glucan 1-alpha-D-glucosylmutase
MKAPTPERIPVSTYRLQLSGRYTLRDAAKLVPYLDQIGITELYCSPILAASPGSPHCYDICDHSRINPELGGEEGFAELAGQLKAHRMGFIFDLVPNHMGIDPSANHWWRDVLENGPSSQFATYFDIDWYPVKHELQDKVLLPILGDQYGVVLDQGQLQITFENGDVHLRYFDRDLPLNPRQLSILLRHNLEVLEKSLAHEDPHLTEFLSILFHLDHLPAYTRSDPSAIEERRREKEVAKRRLALLAEGSPRIRRHIKDNIRAFNGTPGDPTSFDLLHQLLEAQPYRLSFWRTAMHEINYRRFFDINELAAIRMEDPEVFEATHETVLRLIREGSVTGLRLDHVDGLFDPPAYFRKLHERCGPEHRIYTVAEKILSEGERLPEDWAVHGTTGYEFLNTLNSLYVHRATAHEFRKLYTRITGDRRIFVDVAYASKKLIVTTSMAGELNVLAHELNRISESDRHYRDYTLRSLQDALIEVVACFPVYRTYFDGESWDDFDRHNLDVAVDNALWRNPATEPSIFAFIREMLLPHPEPNLPEQEYRRRARFAMKFQQYTGPVQAKGMEDTAFYRHDPLLSLNEVGGDPGRFGITLEQFHVGNRDRLARYPLTMSATSTHDTKRGEDARARLNILSEIPTTWRETVMRWTRINAPARSPRGGEAVLERGDEYLYYQALLGAWPADCEGPPDRDFVNRMREYMRKATKEKKVRTSWINPSESYDEAVANFVEQTLTGTRSKPFLAQFLPFQSRVARLGMVNSLSQLILKITSPGVPDLYQGSELWDLSLVDPDNRRPVDFAARARQLERMLPVLEHPSVNTAVPVVTEMLDHWRDGRIKQYLTSAALRFRKQHARLFQFGEYLSLFASGKGSDHVVAFVRRLGPTTVLVVAPRLVTTLVGFEGGHPLGSSVWGDTRIQIPNEWAAKSYRNVFTGETITPPEAGEGASIGIGDVLRVCPVSMLAPEGQEERK